VPLAFLHLIVMPSPHCTDQFIFKSVGLTGCPFPAALCPNHRCRQLDTLNIFSLVFHFNLDTLTAIWTVLYMNWTPSIGSRNRTNLELTGLLVPLTMLSLNHQNHNYGLSGPYFLHGKIWFVMKIRWIALREIHGELNL
jgi:hypothetical protein